MIAFDVLGTPAPKGSGRAMLIGGKARFIAGGSGPNAKAMKSWDVAVREQARLSAGDGDGPVFVDVALEVAIVFRLKRPGSHFGKAGLRSKAPQRPLVKPDIDKLARCTLDSLTGIVWNDDSRIVELLTRKEYATAGNEGARIVVREVT